MKVLHIPFGYFPDVPGGTEVYVAALVRELGARGIINVVAAPTQAPTVSRYEFDGIPVHRVPTSPSPRPLAEMYGRGDSRFALGIADIVATEAPDVVHFHAYTPAINGGLAMRIRSLGPAIALTYHTATVTCQRGTLLRFGNTVCDGRMVVGRCAACVIQQNGIPRPLADVVGRMPDVLGRALLSRNLQGGAWTALAMSALLQMRHADTRDFLGAADVVIALAGWVRTLLIANDVDPAKIVVSPHGVAEEPREVARATRRAPTEQPLRAVMLGRIDEMKGMDLPLAAMHAHRDLHVSLDIYGSVQTENEYVAALRRRVAADSRVRLLPAVRPTDVPRVIAGYDVILVPSQVLETGPLVVLEAHASGVPVIGSDLGGIAERVRDGVDGRLVNPRSIGAWASALREAASDPSLVAKWRAAIGAPRTLADVASQMDMIYRSVARRETSSRS